MWIDYSEELSIGSYLFTLAVAPAIAGGLLLAASLLSWRYCSDTPYFVTGIGFLVISGGLVLASIFVAGFGMIPWILGYLTLGIGQFITLGVLVILSVAPFVSFPFIMISLSSFGSDKGYAFKQNARFSVTTAQSNIKRDSRYLQALEKDRSLVEVRRSKYREHYLATKSAVEKLNASIDVQAAKITPLISSLTALKNDVQKRVNAYNGLHPDEKNLNVVGKVLYLFQHRRADTLKEALVLMDTGDFRAEVLKKFDNMINLIYEMKNQMYLQHKALAAEIKRTRLDLSTRMSSIERTIESTSKDTISAINSVGASINSSVNSVKQAVNSMASSAAISASYSSIYQNQVLQQLRSIQNAI